MQRPTFQDAARLEKKMILVQMILTKVNYKSIFKKNPKKTRWYITLYASPIYSHSEDLNMSLL